MHDFPGLKSGVVFVGPDKWVLLKEYKPEASKIYNFEVRPSDVWIVTYPRSGTTWTQELIWMIANDLDFEKASKKTLIERFPFLEYYVILHPEKIKDLKKPHRNSPEILEQIDKLTENMVEVLERQKERRFIKTHLPFSLLPPDLLTKGCKVVYVARNPLDAAVSYYHLHRSSTNFDYIGNFQKFWTYFKNDLISFSPYWKHIKQGWERKDENNLLFLFYEDLIQDSPGAIKKAGKFLSKPLALEQINKLEDYLRFENFKNNKSVNITVLKDLGVFKPNEHSFVRKGRSGGWRDNFSEGEAKEAEKWVQENQEALGIKF